MLPFAGSSPRVRGLTTGASPAPAPCRDHPRGCGAHTLSCVCTESKRGSSPRVRGSPSDVDITAHLLGIIPAGAGLTRRSAEQVPRSRDHPRGCGAHRSNLSRRPPCRGSSPRVRGSLHLSACLVSFFGIIPAGAGLTSAELQTTLGCGDHPRGCGAHLTRTSASGCLMGSSPRVRGSPLNFSMLLLSHGIIPAGAGLTSELFDATIIARDHPRGCGAHPRHHQGFCREQGSSPRVRGSP